MTNETTRERGTVEEDLAKGRVTKYYDSKGKAAYRRRVGGFG